MKINVFPDDATIHNDPEGDTLQVHENDSLNTNALGHLGDWEFEEEDGSGAKHGWVKLRMPIMYMTTAGQGVLIDRGHYLHYGPEGFFVWKESHHEEVMSDQSL